MSKLSFRARALDATKHMPVYKAEEIPDMPDFAAINRAVPQMPTGMEKEEETEHHLQRALSAQQVYGTAEALVIPVPEVADVEQRYKKLYVPKIDFKPPKQYFHVQAFGMDQEIPDYDMDSEDECWMGKQTQKMEVSELQFEKMMDRLEKGSGQQVVTLHDAKALLKEDDDLTISVYDYWLNKRLRMQHSLIYQVKTEKRDGSTTNNPYVAFRRRTEKMQTRKNRKNDEASYEKQLKLRRDLNRTLTILEMTKRREKSKKELLKLTIEIFERRYHGQDWDNKMFDEAMSQRHNRPSYVPHSGNQYNNVTKGWTGSSTTGTQRKRREYRRKPKVSAATTISLPGTRTLDINAASTSTGGTTGSMAGLRAGSSAGGASTSATPLVHLPHYGRDQYYQPRASFSSDDEMPSPPASPEPEVDDDPDGIYAFKRKAGCTYQAALQDGLGDWPWSGRESPTECNSSPSDDRFSYKLTSLPSRFCIGYTRRRIGRGGRVIFDRTSSAYDDDLVGADLSSQTTRTSTTQTLSPQSPSPPSSSKLSELLAHIRGNRYRHFRPASPVCDDDSCSHVFCHRSHSSSSYPHHQNPKGVHLHGFGMGDAGASGTNDDSITESYNTHHEALLSMQRQQQEQLLHQQTNQLDTHSTGPGAVGSTFTDMDHGFSSSTTVVGCAGDNGRTQSFTLDSATAQFAVSAVRTKDGLVHSKGMARSGGKGIASVDAKRRKLDSGGSAVGGGSGGKLIGQQTNGPTTTAKAEGFSTAPAATVLELNYPIASPLTSAANSSSFTINKTKTVTKSTNVNKTVLSNSTSDSLATQLGVSGVMTKCQSSPALIKLTTGQNINAVLAAPATPTVQRAATTGAQSALKIN